MDPFRYHDINELGTSPEDLGLDSSSQPLNLRNLSRSPAMTFQKNGVHSCLPIISVPIVLPGTPGEISEVTGSTDHHLVKTRTHCTQPGFHVISSIVQNRPQSKPRAIPRTSLLTHNHHQSRRIGIPSTSAPCAFNNGMQEWRTSAYNCSVGTMSPPNSPSNSLSDLPSQTSSPPSSPYENGSWRQRTFSQTNSTMSATTAEGFRPCSFCVKNGERPIFFNSHQLHYMDNGIRKVSCPILRSVRCSICGATGDIAHTLSHCPHSANKVPVALLLKNTARQCNGSLRKRFD